MNCDDVKTLISAYADGELATDAGQRVAAHIEQCATCRCVVADLARLSRDIRKSGKPAVSAQLRGRIMAALAEERAATAEPTGTTAPSASGSTASRWQLPDWRKIAAVLALCIVSSAATFVATEQHDRNASALSDLVAAHTRSLLQDNPVQVASSDNHTVRPWFAGRVDFAPSVKDLASDGFALTGGRLDVIGGQRVAVAVYKHGMHWINVYMWPANTPLPVSEGLVTRNGYNVLTWTREGVVYSAVSDANKDEMRQFALMLQQAS